MPVTISVSRICDALYLAKVPTDDHGEGAPSTTVLGQWFHEALKLLVNDRTKSGPLAALGEVAADVNVWKQTLVSQMYQQYVGPQLTRQQAALQDLTPQILTFWEAIQAACHWAAELTWTVHSTRTAHRIAPLAPWQSLAEWFSSEESLECEFREPGWTDSVRLVGIADAVVRLANTGMWCAIEFKLGRTSPLVDLAQACLYHLILTCIEKTQTGTATLDQPPESAGTLAVIRFFPERSEQVFTTSQLAEARQRLIDVIGALAHVRPNIPAGKVWLSVAGGDDHFQSNESIREKIQPTEAHRELGRGIVKTFGEFGVNISLGNSIDVGPAFLRFPVQLGRGTKVSAVKKLAEDLQVRLGLKAAPFIYSDEGKLVIDVQRPDRVVVNYHEIRSQLVTPNSPRNGSRVPVGVDLAGTLICADLTKPEHSHFLVAGTTGSGKSEWLRLAIAGLIETNTPDTLRLLVIDPKRNAFHALRESPYLWRPIVFPDEHSAVAMLEELSAEMDRRYRICEGVDSFAQLVEKSDEPLPRIVCVCDEYRDLISRNRHERRLIETQISRLGAKARAAGIHLILATQEPSRDTIKGPLDSNIPARVGLKMGKDVESRMLLSEKGAENLLGHGDLLFKDIGHPRRLQAPFLNDEIRNEIFGRGVKR